MENESIINDAVSELSALTKERPWMTARNLSIRIRKKHGKKELTQTQLFKVLMDHCFDNDLKKREGRRIRPSILPSRKTLEPLWGAIREGIISERDDASPPILYNSGENYIELLDEKEIEGDSPDTFLSYNQLDEKEAQKITSMLEKKGRNVWMAGEKIVFGDNINEKIIKALNQCKDFFVYITENSLQSRWVSKEALVSSRLNINGNLILDGNNDQLVRLVNAWSKSESLEEVLQNFENLIMQYHTIPNNICDFLREHVKLKKKIYIWQSESELNEMVEV